jgi:hypothetical protein
VLALAPQAPLLYKLNGLATLAASTLLYVVLCALRLRDPLFLADHFWECFAAANVFGLSASVFYYLRGWIRPPRGVDVLRRAPTVDMVGKVSDKDAHHPPVPPSLAHFFYDFYTGFEVRKPFISSFFCIPVDSLTIKKKKSATIPFLSPPPKFASSIPGSCSMWTSRCGCT